MAHIDITVVPHNSLNYSRGVISAVDLLNVPTDEIQENMQDQRVCNVRRVTIRRDGQVLNIKHLILTFSTSHRDLVRKQSVKALDVHRLGVLYHHARQSLEKAMNLQPTKHAQPFNVTQVRLQHLKNPRLLQWMQPAYVALQETFLKSTMTVRVRGYNCVRRDVDGDTSPTGGVCLFTRASHLYPSNVVTLHTSLQAVAVRIHIHSLVIVCCVYLPPNDVVPQVDLNRLVDQLPAQFIFLGDFNGYSPLWGHDGTNSPTQQTEQLISDHYLLSAKQRRENVFPCGHEVISLPRSSHLYASSATDVEFRS
ncbi:putative RNA-directed DNA polymerase from transposon X-element [Trichonephila clavipes]|nr:putative RNA-directed DNA polymerase from transposon X-element [Trichonephila clavipes]